MNYPYPPPPPPPPSGSPLDLEINKAVAQGWTLVSRDQYHAVLNRGGHVRHTMHGIISLVTLGTWLWGWAAVTILGARQAMTLTMDAGGHVRRQGPKSRAPYLAGLAALFVVFVIIVSVLPDDDSGTTTAADPATTESSAPAKAVDKTPSPKAAAKPKPAPKPKAKPVVVRATDLIKEFQDSEFTADKKYKDKTLRVTDGVVASVDAQFFNDDKYDVSFDGGGDFEILSITCRSVADKYLDHLAPGQSVTVTGKFVDGGDLGVQMKSCDF